MNNQIRHLFFRLRYCVRKQPWIAASVYMLPNLFHAVAQRSYPALPSSGKAPRGKLALCLRFRDEARFLAEWLEYHVAAGVDHFFLYNNFSADEFQEVLRPYVEEGQVTLIRWPRKPASPAAENDCIARTRGRFEWVGFIDADEFVVVGDGRPISDFLSEFGRAPAVALHWYYYGSNSHEKRPQDWVVRAYTRRNAEPDAHFKVFVRPEQVTRNRNSHNFYYRGAQRAVDENGRSVYGSMAHPPAAKRAWINHYFCKSLEDYLEKAMRPSTLDEFGMREPSRQVAKAKSAMAQANEIVDYSARDYFEKRCAARLGASGTATAS